MISPFTSEATRRLEAFWSGLNYKIYVVTFTDPRGKRRRDTKYIRVNSATNSRESRAKAARAALAASVEYSPGSKLSWGARLAHPVLDLQCTWTGAGPSPL